MKFHYILAIALATLLSGCVPLSVRHSDPSDPITPCCGGAFLHGGRKACRGRAGGHHGAGEAAVEEKEPAVPGVKFHPVPIQPAFSRQP